MRGAYSFKTAEQPQNPAGNRWKWSWAGFSAPGILPEQAPRPSVLERGEEADKKNGRTVNPF